MLCALPAIQVSRGPGRCSDRGSGGPPWTRMSGATFEPASPAINTSPVLCDVATNGLKVLGKKQQTFKD